MHVDRQLMPRTAGTVKTGLDGQNSVNMLQMPSQAGGGSQAYQAKSATYIVDGSQFKN